MKRMLALLLITLCVLSGCTAQGTGRKEVGMSYTQIDQETAKEMMQRRDGHVIVDVRRQEEYDQGHIPGAVLIPNEQIGTERPEKLPDRDQVILVYCRSGSRSKQAAQKLADMGYTRVVELGGLNTWTGEVVRGEGKPAATGVSYLAGGGFWGVQKCLISWRASPGRPWGMPTDRKRPPLTGRYVTAAGMRKRSGLSMMRT